MIQIGCIGMGVVLVIAALYALAGKEKPEKKTPPAVAWAMLVIGIGLVVFALFILPGMVARA